MENFEELKRAVEIVELKDARAHNIVALDSTVPFLSCFSQVIGDTLCDSLQPIDFKRGLNEICELYGSSLSLDAVEESCRRFGLEASAAICFKAARIVILLIDDGIKLNKKLDIQWHETLVPTVGRILQVEHVAEKILEKGPNGTLWTLGSFMEAFTKELKSEAEKVVAFKSIVAHHNGLSVNTEVTQKEAEESLNDVLCARKPIRISNKSFVDYIFMHALEVAQNFDLPMQIDTDFGDKDLDLRPANPLNLRNLLEDKRFTNNRIVLLHASFPFIKEASYLASVYPQVYLDFGLAIPKLSFQAMVSSLKEILELAPMNKVMNNTGGIAFAERFYLGAKKAREVVFKVLWDACIDGDLSITEALAAVNDIFAQNAKQFYKLDASSRYSDVESQSLSSSQKEELNGPLTDVKLVRLMWLDFSAQHRCRVVLQHRFYSSVKNHGLGLTVECIRLSSTSDNLSEEHSLPPSGEVRVVPDLSTKCRLPWARNQEMVLVDMLTEPGKAWQYCPRDVLRRFSKMLEDEFGLESFPDILYLEFLFNDISVFGVSNLTSYCSTAAIDIASSVLEEAVASLQCLNIIVEQEESSKEEEVNLPSSITGLLDDTFIGESEIGERIQGETIGRLDRPDLKTYSRRNKAEEAIMQSSEAEPSSTENESDLAPPNILYLTLSPTILSPSYRAFALYISSVSIPQNWRKAFADPKWKQGFTQTYGVDYQETFAPVAKMNTIKILLSCAANLDSDLQQFDVKNTFLHGDLEEEVYMEIPPGFDTAQSQGKLCRLKKALYILKQTPGAWFDRFNKAMISFGYQQNNADHTLFIRHQTGKFTHLIVYVDDIVMTRDDKEEMTRLKKLLAHEFKIRI
uniref:Protein fluG-like n=1 Tax=Nicotiana tabacum TaxID=4097 RepID=A0A1S3X5F4_TOBAC|nr:PREDICTED: protein fluG-like [Nicotiana tabacum]